MAASSILADQEPAGQLRWRGWVLGGAIAESLSDAAARFLAPSRSVRPALSSSPVFFWPDTPLARFCVGPVLSWEISLGVNRLLSREGPGGIHVAEKLAFEVLDACEGADIT